MLLLFLGTESSLIQDIQVQHVKYMMRCCATTRGVCMELEVIPGQCWVLLNWNVLGEPTTNCNLLSRDFQCNVYTSINLKSTKTLIMIWTLEVLSTIIQPIPTSSCKTPNQPPLPLTQAQTSSPPKKVPKNPQRTM